MALLKPSSWGIVRAWRDIENYRDFIRVIKNESRDPNSKFSKWKLKHNPFYTVYFTMDIEDTEAQLPEKVQRLRLIESLAPLHRYLDEELGFAECLTPEFNRFYDNEGDPTLTYLISYRFSFNKISLKWFLKWTIILSGILFVILKYDLPVKLFQWFQTLI